MKVFSTKNSSSLGNSIANELTLSLCETEVFKFPDGEKRVRILENVVGEDVIVVSSPVGSVDEVYFELFFLIDSLKRSGASKITLVIPYLAYERQDHIFRDGESVSLDVIATFIDSFKLQKIISFDLHTIKIEEIFKTPLIHLSALPVFAEEIKKFADPDTFLVSPDMGGIRRIEILSKMLNNMPFAQIAKDRNLQSGHISDKEIYGEIGKKAVIVDDICSSGKTLAQAAKILKEKGTNEVKAFITHAVFAKGAADLLQQSAIDEIIVTDSIPSESFDKLRVVSIVPQIVESIKS